MNDTQIETLLDVAANPGATPADIGERIGGSRNAVQKRLKRMEASGLVESKDDGYHLRPEGRRIAAENGWTDEEPPAGPRAVPDEAPAQVRDAEYRRVDLTLIDPSPFQKRRFPEQPTAEDLDMVASIREHDVLEPVLLRPSPGGPDRFELCGGERRCRNARRAGMRSVPAVIRDFSDDEAAAVVAVENLQRKDLDWQEASDTVAMLLARPGWTVESVASSIGRPESWVARMESLQHLSPAWRSAAEDPQHAASGYSPSHLLAIARLPAETQDRLLDDRYRWNLRNATVRDLQGIIGNFLMVLKRAPWRTDDAVLYPEAGACEACVKRSSCNPLLFEDLEEGGVEADDRCLDKACWGEKQSRFVEIKRQELKRKHGRVVLVHDRSMTPSAGDPPAVRAAVPDWKVDKVRKDKDGAVPVLETTGANAGHWYWGEERLEPSSTGPGGRRRRTLREKVELLDIRRRLRATELVKAEAAAAEPPSLASLVALTVAFGTNHRYDVGGYNDGDPFRYEVPQYDDEELTEEDLEAAAEADPDGDLPDVPPPPPSIPREEVDAAAAADPFLLYPSTEDAKTGRWSHYDAHLKLVTDPAEEGRLRRYLWARLWPVIERRVNFWTNCDVATKWYELLRLASLTGVDAQAALERAHEELPEPQVWAKDEDYEEVRRELAHLFTPVAMEAPEALEEAS